MRKLFITLLYSSIFQFCFSQTSFQKYLIDWVYDPVTVYTCSDKAILEGGERLGVSVAKRDSNGQPLWAHNYTLDADCDLCSPYLSSCGQTQDGYFCAGKFDDFGNNKQSAFIAPLDSIGNLLWAKRYSTDDEPAFPPLIRQVDQGNFIIWLMGKFHMALIKVNSSGNIVWSKRVYSSSDDTTTWCRAPYISPNGNSIGQGQYDGFYYFFSVNTTGELNWMTQFVADNAMDDATVISQVEGGDVLIGEHSSYGSIIMKVDADGNYVWEKTIEGANFEHIFMDRIVATRDSTYFISGRLNGFPLFMRLDDNGNLLSSYIIPFDSVPSTYVTLDTISNNQVLINASIADTFFFFKVNPALDNYCRFVPYNLTASDITPNFFSSKGGYVVDVAATESDLSPNYQGNFAMEFNDYCEMVGINEPPNKNFRIYPNPAHDFITVSWLQNEPSIISIIDVTGRKIKEMKVDYSEQRIDISELPTQLYLLLKDGKVLGKFSKE